MGSLHVGMGKRKPSRRARERVGARAHEDLVHDLDRLARHAPGGSPRRPITVEAPTQVEPIAHGTACPLCEGAVRIENHAAETHDGVRLRVAHVRCTRCGRGRVLYFRLASALLH